MRKIYQHKYYPLGLILSFFLTGCINLAPLYERPQIDLADTWITESLNTQKSILNDTDDINNIRTIGWKEFFLDKQLQALIETAITHNHDLRKC